MEVKRGDPSWMCDPVNPDPRFQPIVKQTLQNFKYVISAKHKADYTHASYLILYDSSLSGQ